MNYDKARNELVAFNIYCMSFRHGKWAAQEWMQEHIDKKCEAAKADGRKRLLIHLPPITIHINRSVRINFGGKLSCSIPHLIAET